MMKPKTAFSFILTAALCAPLFAGVSVLTAQAEEPSETQPTAMTAENCALFLPESHEEYLPLTVPSHVAFSEDYIAVADGAVLYLYDRAAGEYRYYEHKTGADAVATTLSELQFAPDGTLYFTDQSTALYTYDFSENSAVRQNISSCSTFIIADDCIYYTATATGSAMVTFYYVPLSTPVEEYRSQIVDYNPGVNPHLAYENGALHCIINENFYTTYDTKQHTIIAEGKRLDNTLMQIAGLRYVCAYGGSLYYTVSGAGEGYNGLYRTDQDGNAALVLPADSLTTLTVYDNRLYCVQGASVKEIAVTAEGARFTGYEIAAASSSVNRLSGAVNTVRAGNLLVTADKGNNRVSVYNLASGGYSAYPVANASIVATDGTIVAATDGDVVTVFNGTEQESYSIGDTLGKIKGLACLFGKTYYVTENNAYGVAGENYVFYSGYGVPTGLTCDLYGMLYVSYHDGKVYAYHENDFAVRGTPERLTYTLPETHASVRADFEGNLYCLSGNTLYKNGAPFAAFSESEALVYRGSPLPLSFALGFEDDRVYFNFGDYVLASKEGSLDIPTLDKIPLDGAHEQIFSTGNAQEILVDVAENAVGIDVDLSQIGQAERYFPYAGYSRTAAMRGVKLAQTSKYILVLLENDGKYKALLLRAESVTAVEPSEYYAESQGEVYLCNAVNACYYPCMEAALMHERLHRGALVTQRAIVNLPDREYALVSYASAEGETLVYVPLSYLTVVDPNGMAQDRYTLGYLKAGETVFTGENGETLTVTERTAVRLYKQDDGNYTVRFDGENGVTYTAKNVSAKAVEYGSSDALRTSLIIILSVLAVLIIGLYIYFLPLRKKRSA